MLDIHANYATDETLENEGSWKEIGGDAAILVARSGNRAYSKLMTKLYQQNQELLKLGDDAAERKSDEIMIQVLAETVLLGWRNLGYQKKPIDYSVANAKKLLAHKDFRRVVTSASEDLTAYLVKEETAQGEA